MEKAKKNFDILNKFSIFHFVEMPIIHGEKGDEVVVNEDIEEAKGVVKHVVLGKFKDDIAPMPI